MLKKLAIALFVLLLIAAVIGGVAAYKLNATYGWTRSETVHHAVAAGPETRFRLSVDPLRLARDLAPSLPEETALPAWIPWDLPALLPSVLPREIAVLGGSDLRDGLYRITLFANEQRFGTWLPEALNQNTSFLEARPEITWEAPGFVLQGRGDLRAKGTLPLPEELEPLLTEYWPQDAPEDSLTLTGGHLAELLVDNRGGEVVALLGALAPLWNSSFSAVSTNPNFKGALDLLVQVDDIRAAADFRDVDTLLIQVLLHADPAVRGQLEFMVPFALPLVAGELKRQYGLDAKIENKWVEEESAYKIEIAISGMEAKLKEYFQRTLGVPPAP